MSPSSITSVEQTLQSVLEAFEAALSAADSVAQVEEIRVQFLGRNSDLNAVRKTLGSLSPEERPVVGARANEVSQSMDASLNTKLQALKREEMNAQLEAERIDVTMPGTYRAGGTTHPLTLVIERMTQIFHGMGYNCLDDDHCPEVETEY